MPEDSPETELDLQPSSGNIFEDLGLPDADVLMIKSRLGASIHQILTERNLTQSEAAKILGVHQPRISDLFRGHFDGYTIDRLIRYLNRLGLHAEIVVKESLG